jgi:hypothetical protein
LSAAAGEMFEIRMKASEQKEESLQKIRFEAAASFVETSKATINKKLRLRLNEIILGKTNPMIVQTEDGIYNPNTKAFNFPRFEFTSDMSLSSTPVPNKNFILEVLEIDPKKPDKPKQFGRTQFLLRDALRRGATGKISLFILDEKNNYKGKFEISNCSARRFYTFFDLQLRNQLNIVPIIGVDFSLANLTFDDQRPLIHTLKPGQ